MARRTKLTPALARRICRLIERGNYPQTAAVAEGVPERTWRDWLQRGRAGEAPFDGLVAACDRARARAEADLVELVRKGDTKSRKMSRAAGWLLERTRGQRFGTVVRHRVEDELERLLDVVERVVAPEDFRRVIEALAAADRAEEAGEDPAEVREPAATTSGQPVH
jgi:hypothetical protein